MGSKGKPYLKYPDREYENRIHEIRIQEGYTVTELAKKIGLKYPAYLSSLANGQVGVIALAGENKGKVRPWVEKLLKVFSADASYVFPREICDIARTELIDTQISDMTTGENDEIKKVIQNNILGLLLSTLTKRECLVLRERYLEERPLSAIAEDLNLSRARIQQIECKALRKLQNKPTQLRALRPLINRIKWSPVLGLR